MTMSDPIADMLTRIRNGSRARHSSCDMPYSRIKQAIAEVLRDEGYIDSFEDRGEGIHACCASTCATRPAVAAATRS